VITKSACQFYLLESPTAVRALTGTVRGNLRSAAFSPDARWLAVSDVEHLQVWDLVSQGPGLSIRDLSEAHVFFSDAGELFAFGPKGSLRGRLDPGVPNSAPTVHQLSLPTIGENDWLCVVSNAFLWTAYRGSTLGSLETPSNQRKWFPTAQGVNGISPNGRRAAVFHQFTDELHIYKLPGFEAEATLTNRSQIRTFAFSPSGDQLAVIGRGQVEFWNTQSWERTGELTNVLDFLYAPKGSGWWLTRDYRSGGLYDPHSHQPLLPLPTGTLPVAVSQDGRYLAASVDARRVEVWDLVQVRRLFRDLGIDWRDR
jgi:hypothetical protein